jgi:hypothetical protein
MNGFILLYRSIFDHWVSNDNKYFFRWCYLLAHAAYKRKIIYFEGVEFIQERGQVISSQRKLAFKWGTNNDGVKDFLNKLKKSDMVTYVRKGKATIITICNYDRFQIALKDDGFDPYSDGFSSSQNAENSSEISAEKAKSPSRRRSTTKKNNNIINNKTDGGDSAHAFVVVLEEAMQRQKIELACKKHSITEQLYKKLVEEIIDDWKYQNEVDISIKHLQNTLRIKVEILKQKQKEDGQRSRAIGQNTTATSGSQSGENPLDRAKVYRAESKDKH